MERVGDWDVYPEGVERAKILKEGYPTVRPLERPHV